MGRIMNISKGLLVLIGIFALFTECEAGGCQTCHTEMRDTIDMLSDMIKDAEPIQKFNQTPCAIVEVRGVSTMKYNNKSCMQEQGMGKEGKCYKQTFEIYFELFELGCVVHPETLSQAMAEAGKAAVGDAAKKLQDAGKNMMGNMAGKLGFGKRAANNENFILNASWVKPIFDITMHVCFQDDVYEVTDASVSDQYDGLKIWCEGSQGFDQACKMATSSDYVRSNIGFAFKQILKLGLPTLLKNPEATELLGGLNCGEPE